MEFVGVEKDNEWTSRNAKRITSSRGLIRGLVRQCKGFCRARRACVGRLLDLDGLDQTPVRVYDLVSLWHHPNPQWRTEGQIWPDRDLTFDRTKGTKDSDC